MGLIMENILLRRLNDSDEDYMLLSKWCSQKEIYVHFEQMILSLDEIKKKYYVRTLKDTDIPVYMIEYNKIPVGIIQYQLVSNENKELYKIDGNKCYEIDIFIGELDYHNRGIAKNSIRIMCNYLFKNKNADILVMCPLKGNEPAINCYLGCGFEIKNKYFAKDTIGNMKEYILMIKDNVKKM